MGVISLRHHLTGKSLLFVLSGIGFVFLFMFFLTAHRALAAGGACPTSASYLNATASSLVTLASLGITNCYYVAANGADTNSGTSESSPWLHAPFMPNCSNNCLTVENQNANLWPGIGVILRGGDTWHFGNSAASPYAGGVWNFNTGQSPMGTASNPIYVGVDQTWFAGASWTRPILTADNPLCNANTANGTTCVATTDSYGQPTFYVSSCLYQIGSQNAFIETSALQYYIIDNFEMMGLCQSDVGQPSHHDTYVSYGSLRGPMTFEDLYIHGWSHLLFAGHNGSVACTSTAVCINIFAFMGGVSGGGVGETIQDSIVDGSDSDGPGAGLCYGGFYNVAYNVFRYTSQCIPTTLHTFHDNLYEDFFENGHSNLLEAYDAASDNAIYNNVFRHVENYLTSGGGVGIWLTPDVGNSDYLFNNLMYDVGNMEYFNAGQNGSNEGGTVLFNNVLQTNSASDGISCSATGNSSQLTADNNHYISDGGGFTITSSSNCWSDLQQQQTNLTETNAVATSRGYTSAETYAYSPTSSSSPTVGAGTNEQAFCNALSSAGLSAAASACESNTTYACAYNQTNHTVSCPAQTATARPASGAWDVGAYQYTASIALSFSVIINGILKALGHILFL